ncbi:stage 0 sporulation regulatory protein [Bacillus oleivorans]|uniref:Stage 0 sporulation regulatory protein n=1 Tax=Bacillus oleivorans TaxID=1448271 RepID=A0A285CKX5_9BACI|nr:stage 0 sporulation regulatory protein [Bacillus oleivorans]
MKIEALRQRLIDTASYKGIQSPETLKISRELDRVLNQVMEEKTLAKKS